MDHQQELQHTTQLRQLLSKPHLSPVDRSHALYKLGTAQLHMALMEPTSVTGPVEQMTLCHEGIQSFKECY